VLVTKTTPFTLVILISIRKVAKAESRQVEPWLTNMRSTSYKLDMALREPMAHQRSRKAYSSDGVTQRTVQVTAVTAVHTTVNRKKRNLKGRGKEGTAAAVARLEETHSAHHADEPCGAVNLLVCYVVSAGKQLTVFRRTVPIIHTKRR